MDKLILIRNDFKMILFYAQQTACVIRLELHHVTKLKDSVFASIPILETPAAVVRKVSQKIHKQKSAIHRASARLMEVMLTAMATEPADSRVEMPFVHVPLDSRTMDFLSAASVLTQCLNIQSARSGHLLLRTRP